MSLNLSERKQKILSAIVEDYLNTAEPVGSRTISKKYLPNSSPATIRNEMSDLEEEGYIKQPHTSAGRIPADLGYRYYVDKLMKPKSLSQREIDFIKKEYKRVNNDIGDILGTTLKILTTLSDYATILTSPKLYQRAIKIVNMVLVDIHRAVVVLLTDSGQTDNMILKLPNTGIDQNDLIKISNLLTEKLQGVNILKLNSSLIKEIISELPVYKDILEDTLHLIKNSMEKLAQDKVMSAGLANIVKQPEFSDGLQMKNILNMIEQDNMLSDMLNEHSKTEGISIAIGSEIKYREIHNCSMVVTRYNVTEDTFGTLGIMGPTRMPYNKIKSIVECVSDTLSSLLTEELF